MARSERDPPLDEPEAPPGRYRMDVIVMCAEYLAVLRVLRSTRVT